MVITVDCGSARVSLLDLPDDLLRFILRYLDISAELSLRGRSLRDGPSGFALALTCKRLFRVFRSSLQTVDAFYPSSYDRHLLCLPDAPLSAHVASILRTIGDNLRALRLVPHCNVSLSIAGKAWCTRLEEISYARDELSATFESAVFSSELGSTRTLRHVCVFDPREVFRLMHNLCALEQLVLTGVRPQYINGLTGMLQKAGGTLRVLDVGFDATILAQEYCSDLKNPRWCISVLTAFVHKALNNKTLPVLEQFHLASARREILDADELYAETPEEQFLSGIHTRLANRIGVAREKSKRSLRESTLRRLSLHASRAIIESSVETLDKLVTGGVDVEVQVQGTTIVFPASKSPYVLCLHSLKITQLVLRHWPADMLRAMRTVMRLGIAADTLISYRNRETRNLINQLTAATGPALRELCIPDLRRSLPRSRIGCRFVADVLGLSPSVTTIEIPAELVAMAVHATSELEFTRMCYAMRNVRVLRIRSCARPSYLYGSAFTTADILPFAKGLPAFLKNMGSCCPLLEFVLLQATEDFEPIENYESVEEQTRLSLQAVNELEAVLPRVDAGSVRTQLQVWLNRAM